MRKALGGVVVLTVLVVVASPAAAQMVQYGSSVCTGASTGNPPTSAVVQRSPAGANTWTTLSPDLPMSGTPAKSAAYIDTSRVAGVSYQYRCLEKNEAGATPTDPSASFTFVDVTTPDKGVIGVTVITQ